MNKKVLIQVYAAICVLGFLPAIYPLATIATSVVFGSFPVQVFPHVQPFMYEEKRIEIVAYLIAIPAIAVYAYLIYLLSKRQSRDTVYSKAISSALLAVALVADALAWKYSQRSLSAIWAIAAALPFLDLAWDHALEAYGRKSWSVGLVIASVAVLVAMMAPFLFLKPHIACEYLDIPTVTILSTTKEVDTGAFLAENRQIGFMKADPSTGEFVGAERFPSVHIEANPLLQSLLADRSNLLLGAVIEKVKIGTDSVINRDDDGVTSYNIESVVYDNSTRSLVAIGKISDEYRWRLLECVKPSEEVLINELCARSSHIAATFTSQQYTAEQAKFILQNKNEFETGFLARRIIHHHNFLLGSIQEFSRGRPVSEINLQYGYLFVWGMSWVLDKVGGVSYQAYVPLLYSFYVLYYLLAVWIVYRITGSRILAAIFLCLSVSVQGLVGYEAMAIAPGMNPVRHIFDFIMFLLLFMHFKRGGLMPVIGIYALCVLSILNNRQTGLFLSLAACSGIALNSLSMKRIGYVSLIMSGAFGALALLFSFKLSPGKDELSAYYVAGLCGFPTHRILMISVLGLCAAGAWLLMAKWEELQRASKMLLVVTMAYTLMMFLYYVWGGSKYHFYNYAPIYLFTGLVLIDCWINSEKSLETDAYHVRRSLGLLGIASSIILLFSFAHYEWLYSRYASVFKSHTSYEWDLPKANIVSTMSPELFKQSVHLIQRYSPEPGIFIVSEYDNFLPFLADKYSAMPFPDLQWFVNSETEKKACIDSIKSTRPKYLFTDAAIGRQFMYEVVDTHVPLIGGMQSEAILRAHRLRVIQDIFNAVKDDYTFREKSGLLAVWERNQ